MELKLYDTLTREKRVFTPLDPKNLRMYVCGPTVYDFAHIGNARPVIVFDVLYRLLRHLYGTEHVTYVRNITDVDDKINARAAERGISIRELTVQTYQNFKDDVAALGCLPPDVEPRATEHIEEMKTLIERLVGSNNAYVAEDHVLFSVPSMPDYGKLARRPLDEMMAGARVDVAPYKRDPMDFVLWKPSRLEDAKPTPLWFWAMEEFVPLRAEPSWPSPAGIKSPGRPGWHIECSAMSWKHLGKIFDIHGGGIDLVFPHHENEIAQSCCAFHTEKMANFWMHNGFLQVEGEKMSKSLGNFIVIRDLLEKWPGEVLRLQMLNTHYRQPIDWTEAITRLMADELEDWSHRITDIFGAFIGESTASVPVSRELIESLSDDLNTPEALSYLRQSAKKIGKDSEKALSFLCDCEFLNLMNRRKLGLLSREFGREGTTPEFMVQAFDIYQQYRPKIHNGLLNAYEEFVSKIRDVDAEVQNLPHGGIRLIQKDAGHSKIEALIEARSAARKARNFAESDRIRDELAAMGVELEDRKDGTTIWKLKKVA